MAVGNINELPENILLELFTHVPARQLLLRCRPVCSLWRDLIDLVTLWKRKCLREGFITEDWDQPVADWKIFYFLRSLQRNLLHNPCAEEPRLDLQTSQEGALPVDEGAMKSPLHSGPLVIRIPSSPGCACRSLRRNYNRKDHVFCYVVKRQESREKPGVPGLQSSALTTEGFEFWSLDVNGGDEWKVEDLSKDQRKEFPNDQVKKYFVTSYYTCLKSQVVDLKAEGYWEELMDTTRPDIEVKDWFAARPDCGSKYQLCVQLLSSAHAPLGTFQPDPVMIQQKSDAKWREKGQVQSYHLHGGSPPSYNSSSKGFKSALQSFAGFCTRSSNHPPGVRYIWFQHGGVDTHYWAGWYGPRVTNSSIIIGPPLP
ncbi:F-box only protein 44 [Apodemus speciosus]|uniref:F-box only protein 44 n=1 Tax=Apodemus speciosus TaxID=105296 RepID=A0ABQ0EQQ1_APOSI